MTEQPEDPSAAGAEQPAPYGPGPAAPTSSRRVRVHHLQQMKEQGKRFVMLTAYEQYSAEIFDEAGVEVLLIGDSAANNVLGYQTTVPITLDEMLPMVRAVTRSARRPLIVADLPFGSYQSSPTLALASATRMMKEGLAHAVKFEGGRRVAPQVRALVRAGIPVMGHIGFTPQSEHALGGYRVQGRGEQGDELVSDARALQDAGAFAIVLEMVPATVAARVTDELRVPTIGIGAGPGCDGQVLVWQDMAGLRGGRMSRFVKQYADLRGTLLRAAQEYADDVRSGSFPGPQHSFDA
jgi:3-methyl-2-oxobutanoate hydroxymethyltransferase